MLKVLRQYPSSISTGACAAVGAGSCALIRILDLRDAWRSAQPKKDLQETLKRQVGEIRTDAFERRRNWDSKEPLILRSRENPDAVVDYANKIPNPPKKLIDELQKTRQRLQNLKIPKPEKRDPKWAEGFLAASLVCFAAGLTRDLG